MSTICTKCKKTHDEITKFCAICKEKERQRGKLKYANNIDKTFVKDNISYKSLKKNIRI